MGSEVAVLSDYYVSVFPSQCILHSIRARLSFRGVWFISLEQTGLKPIAQYAVPYNNTRPRWDFRPFY